MKKFKKALSLLMVLAMLFALTACGGEKEEAAPEKEPAGSSEVTEEKALDDILIGISVGTSAHERWQKEIGMFEEYAAELGVKILVQTAEDDAGKQLSQCENMLSQGVDVLICQPVDSQGAGSIVDAAHGADVKVIAYDRFIENSELDFCVGFDDVQVGQLQAQMVVDACGGKGNIAILKGDVTTVNTHNLYIGNMNVLQPLIDKGDITVVTDQYCVGWGADDAMAHLENALSTTGNDIAGVVCQNDTTATGAVQALAAQQLAGKVPVSGQDCDLSAVQRVVEGTQIGDVYKPLKTMNTAALDLAIMVAQGKDPVTEFKSDDGAWGIYDNGTVEVPAMLMDVVFVNKDNIASVLVADNFYTMEEMYANVPKSEWPQI